MLRHGGLYLMGRSAINMCPAPLSVTSVAPGMVSPNSRAFFSGVIWSFSPQINSVGAATRAAAAAPSA